MAELQREDITEIKADIRTFFKKLDEHLVSDTKFQDDMSATYASLNQKIEVHMAKEESHHEAMRKFMKIQSNTMFGEDSRSGVIRDLDDALEMSKDCHKILHGKDGRSGIIKDVNRILMFATTGAIALAWKVFEFFSHDH